MNACDRIQFLEALRGFDAVYGWEVTIGDDVVVV